MTDSAPGESADFASGAAYRGFLFADLRGFTTFVERHGNAAAAAMVGRFLALAREEVARHDGAEIKTEGDLIHAVFPSASSAVMCGLAIVDAAAAASADDPERPITVGVGVHAGEAVETADGYIGTAVNLAARLCAAAGPGEVLVSATVKGITQASIPVGFVPRGRRRLKGIGEPVEVFAATRDRTATASLSRPPVAVAGAVAVGLVAVAVVAVLLGGQLLGSPGASPSAPSLPPARAIEVGPLELGSYQSQTFQPPFAFTIVDPGWSAYREAPEYLGLLREDAPRGRLDILRVADVFVDPCIEGGETADTGPAATDLIGALNSLAYVDDVTDPEPTSVDGFAGQMVNVTISEGALAACGGLVGGEVAVLRAGDESWKASPGERFRMLAVEVGGQTVTLLLSLDWSQSQSVDELENFFESGERVMQSVKFGGQ